MCRLGLASRLRYWCATQPKHPKPGPATACILQQPASHAAACPKLPPCLCRPGVGVHLEGDDASGVPPLLLLEPCHPILFAYVAHQLGGHQRVRRAQQRKCLPAARKEMQPWNGGRAGKRGRRCTAGRSLLRCAAAQPPSCLPIPCSAALTITLCINSCCCCYYCRHSPAHPLRLDQLGHLRLLGLCRRRQPLPGHPQDVLHVAHVASLPVAGRCRRRRRPSCPRSAAGDCREPGSVGWGSDQRPDAAQAPMAPAKRALPCTDAASRPQHKTASGKQPGRDCRECHTTD